MKRVLYFIIVFLLVGCAEEGRKITELSREVEVKKESKVEYLRVNSIFEIKAKVTGSGLYLNSGKVALMTSNGNYSQKLCNELLRVIEKSFSLKEVGIESKNPLDAISQLDPRDVTNLVEIKDLGNKEFELNLYSTKNSESEKFVFECPFLMEENRVKNLFSIDCNVLSSGFLEDKRIIASDGKKIVEINLSQGIEKTIDLTPCEKICFSDLGDGLIYFCSDNGEKGKIIKEGDKLKVVKSGEFPLQEKMSRFISVVWENGKFIIYDRKGDEIGSFVSMVRIFFNEVTLLICLKEDGNLFAIRGDLIESLPILSEKKFKKISGKNENCFALSEDGKIYRLKFNENFNAIVEEIAVEGGIKADDIVVDDNYLYLFMRKEKTEIKQLNID